MAFNGYKSSYFASCEKLGRTLRWFTGAIWMLSRSGDRGTDMGQLLQGPRLHGRAACCAGRMEQRLLIDLPPPLPANLPPGFAYHRDFLDDDEERELLEVIRSLPLEAARYKGYTARRRVVSFGGSFDYDSNRLLPAAELDSRLHPLRDRVCAWLGVASSDLVHTLVAEYPVGAPLGWHRDVPDFEEIIGVSLGSEAVLRLRPYPPSGQIRARIVKLVAEPRSIYLMKGPARWEWQHSVAPTRTLRWSITFRTRRRRAALASTDRTPSAPEDR